MISFAHIAGMPVEETIASLGPALLLTFGAASATLRARVRRARSSARHDAPRPRRGAARVWRPRETQPDHSLALPQERHIIRAVHSRWEGAEPATPARPVPHCAREAGASEAAPPLSRRTSSERLEAP
jgi:hypothetical protein